MSMCYIIFIVCVSEFEFCIDSLVVEKMMKYCLENGIVDETALL